MTRLLTIATYNLGDGPGKARDLDILAAAGVDVLGLQEAGDRDDMLDDWCRRNRWRQHAGKAPGAGRVPILTAPDVHVDAAISRLAVDERYVGPGAGPDWANPKAIQAIRTGQLWIADTHFVASADRPGTSALRDSHHADHMAFLVRMARRRRRRGLPIVLLGDFNTSPTGRRTAPLRAMGLDQVVKQSTHGDDTFDQIWIAGLDLIHAWTVKLSSDHRAAVATVRSR